jgi:hypothetical protein
MRAIWPRILLDGILALIVGVPILLAIISHP